MIETVRRKDETDCVARAQITASQMAVPLPAYLLLEDEEMYNRV
jgi:hypothetical protein